MMITEVQLVRTIVFTKPGVPRFEATAVTFNEWSNEYQVGGHFLDSSGHITVGSYAGFKLLEIPASSVAYIETAQRAAFVAEDGDVEDLTA